MAAYYSENDRFAAQWLRELIKAGLIADGEVDERDVRDVRPDDLKGYTQCHFFAGIGGWSRALRLAGFSDSRECWTGSCPCQPFSAAGTRAGFADERHLWPHFFHLVKYGKRPSVPLFGEQVASKDGLAWFDLVSSDLEGEGYTVWAADLCGAGFGSPDIRQRLWFVAHPPSQLDNGTGDAGEGGRSEFADGGVVGHPDLTRPQGRGVSGADTERDSAGECVVGPSSLDGQHTRPLVLPASEQVGISGFARIEGEAGGDGVGNPPSQRCGEAWPSLPGPEERVGGAGFWSDCSWIPCIDGKWRPIERTTKSVLESVDSGLSGELGCVRLTRANDGEDEGEEAYVFAPLVARGKNRVGRLRGYGNAIKPPVAAEFIKAYVEVMEGR